MAEAYSERSWTKLLNGVPSKGSAANLQMRTDGVTRQWRLEERAIIESRLAEEIVERSEDVAALETVGTETTMAKRKVTGSGPTGAP